MSKMTKLAAVMLLLAIPALVRADGEKTREVKVPLSRIIELANSLSALDGYQDVVKDGASEKAVPRAYKFEPGLRIVISRNLSALKPILEGYGKDQQALQAEIGGGSAIKPGSDEMVKLNAAAAKLMRIEFSANLYLIGEKELKLDLNPIPGTVLSGLDPIMDWVK